MFDVIMKICIVSHTYNPDIKGGGSISTYTFVKALRERGHEVVVVKNPKKIVKDADIILHQNIKYMVETQKICKDQSIPLVVTVNSNITCCSGAHITNESKYGVPCMKCSFFGALRCLLLNKRNQNRSGSLRLHMRKLSFLATPVYFNNLRSRVNTLNKCDAIVCCSPTLKKLLKISGVTNEKIFVIPSPIESIFSDEKSEKLFDEKVALFCGAPTWIKGAHLAAEAVSKIDNLKLVFSRKLKGSIGEYIKKILKDRVVICEVPYSDMPKLYNSAYVTLFPSIWYEPLGRVWAESCMCGTPVIAFKDRGGASDFLVHEKTALLSDYNVNDYANQIRRLLEDEKLHRKISRNAREFAKKNFSAEVVAKKYEKVFEEVLNG